MPTPLGRLTSACVLCVWAFAPALHAQDSPVRAVTITGANELSQEAIRRASRVQIGEPLPESPDRIAEIITRRYHDDGYSFARVDAAFESATGTLTIKIDEGLIDGVEFQGVDDVNVLRRFLDEFALRAGDVFNRKRALQALEVLLRPTRGAIRPGNLYFYDSRDLGDRRGPFDLIDRNGQRVLLVGLRERAGRFRLVPDFGEREDWFTRVDGFVPSLGFGAAVYDHHEFNHAYVAGHLSYKTASERAGYALGFERPIFRTTKLYVGGELHDLTASDDQWQISSNEASLAAIGPRKSFRDYYRRRGVQINAAVRVHPQVELLLAWRRERQEPLGVESDFSLWNDDEPIRPNVSAQDGRLSALVVGGSFNGDRFDRESLGATYRRHQLEQPFGERLDLLEGRHETAPIWRVDWTSEISTPDGLRSDFDFTRHILSARARVALSEHQDFGVRGIGGWSGGVLPPQRQFAIGGLGSVHGYEFKEAVGDTLALLNLEYGLGWRNRFQIVGFFDAGRVSVRQGPSVESPWLKGVGFGIAVGGARLDFGYKLDQIPSSLKVTLRLNRTF